MTFSRIESASHLDADGAVLMRSSVSALQNPGALRLGTILVTPSKMPTPSVIFQVAWVSR